MRAKTLPVCLAWALLTLSACAATEASAETLAQALAFAYADNPQINSARANTRAVDENVAIAKGGMRPRVSIIGSGSGTSVDTAFSGFDEVSYRSAVGLQTEQPLFRGFRVLNAIREAYSNVLARRETLRNTVQNVLFDAAQTYIGVLLATDIRNLRRRNVTFLMEQVRGIQQRFSVGDLTRTDVAQAQSRLASARISLARAEISLNRVRADYRRIVGHDPGQLARGFPYASLLPASFDRALETGLDDHPFILAAILEADAQAFEVKQVEGRLLPEVSLFGTAVHNESWDTGSEFRNWSNVVTIEGRVRIPLYQGGIVGAQVRQAKEILGQLEIEIDLARDQVRDAIVSSWGDAQTTRAAILAAQDGVQAAENALSGVERELRVGQRTTLDVLDAQQELLNVREALAVATRDEIVSQFSLLSAVGHLSAGKLQLPVPEYDPADHFEAVRNKWGGTRTPDGR